VRLRDVALALGLEVIGDDDRQLSGIAPLNRASSAELAFVSHARFLGELRCSGAAAVIVKREWLDELPDSCAALISANPYLDFARATHLFKTACDHVAGQHPSAIVAPSAKIGSDAYIGPNVVIGERVEVGDRVHLSANCYVGDDCVIEADTWFGSGVTLYHDVRVGTACKIHANAVLGSDGFGFAPSSEGWVKIEQLGGVRVGSRCEIGANTVVDRGALDHTVLGDNVIVDNLVQIAHNCVIGDRTAIAACVGLAGSTVIGRDCTLAGGVGVVGHLEICDGVHVTAMTMVTKSITRPGSYSSGTMMMESTDWRKSAVRMSQLDALTKRVIQLEKLMKAQSGDEA